MGSVSRPTSFKTFLVNPHSHYEYYAIDSWRQTFRVDLERLGGYIKVPEYLSVCSNTFLPKVDISTELNPFSSPPVISSHPADVTSANNPEYNVHFRLLTQIRFQTYVLLIFSSSFVAL